MDEILKNITQTKGGYPVKDLRLIKLDNILVGMVQCPVLGKETLREGYVCVQWTTKGKPLRINKGREDLILEGLL